MYETPSEVFGGRLLQCFVPLARLDPLFARTNDMKTLYDYFPLLLGFLLQSSTPLPFLNPPESRAWLGTRDISLQRSEPSFTPPYHRETTTIVLQQPESSSSRVNLSPLPLSPPSSWPKRGWEDEGSAVRYAYMQCVARLRTGSAVRWSRNFGND